MINLKSILALAVMGVATVAPAKTLLTCGDGEELVLTLKQLPSGKLVADVQVESTGGSYPTFHYTVTKQWQPTNPPPIHAMPTHYIGNGFDLSVAYFLEASGEIPSRLNIPKLGFNKERTNCRR